MSVFPATAFLQERLPDFQPRCALVLGSGLGFFADEYLNVREAIPYEEIPDFPVSTVEGHRGQLLAAELNGSPVLCFQGRFHYYEGYSVAAITHPIRVLAQWGVQQLVLTNAAGGIHPSMHAGDFMVIRDHINFMGVNPLRGTQDDGLGPRFPDMTVAWDPELRKLALKFAANQGLEVHEGVYAAVSGPSFETPAEIRAFNQWGADAVGMSTVPECIVARYCGMQVLGLSCITNLAAGLGKGLLSHEDVQRTAVRVQGDFGRWLRAVLGGMLAPQ